MKEKINLYRKNYLSLTLYREDMLRIFQLFQRYCSISTILIDGRHIESVDDFSKLVGPLASELIGTGFACYSTENASYSEAGAELRLHITKYKARLLVPKNAIADFKELIDQLNSLLNNRVNHSRQINQGIRNFILIFVSMGSFYMLMPLDKQASTVDHLFFELGNVFGITAIIGLVLWIWLFYISPPFMILALDDAQVKRTQAKAIRADWIGIAVFVMIMVGLYMLVVFFWKRAGL